MATKAAERAREWMAKNGMYIYPEGIRKDGWLLSDCADQEETILQTLAEYEAATIERCAQIAESEKVDYEATKAAGDLAYNLAIEHVAAAIRSMGEQK